MMVIPYTLLLFIFGWCTSHFIATKWVSLLRLAYAPVIAFLFLAIVTFSLNMAGIAINRMSLLAVVIPVFLLVILLKGQTLKVPVISFIEMFKVSSKVSRFFIVLVTIFLLSFLLRAEWKQSWGHDAEKVWVGKPMEWVAHQKLDLTPETKHKLRNWSSYPLLHTVTVMDNIILLDPLKQKNAANVSDFIYYLGLMFAFMYLFRKLGAPLNMSFFLAFAGLFFQREVLGHVGTGIAGVDVMLFIFLVFCTFAFSKDDLVDYLAIGTLLGMLVITKNEGVYRAFFLLLFMLSYRFKEVISPKRLLVLFIPVLFLWGLNKINMHTIPFNEWYSGMVLSLSYVLSRIPLVITAFVIQLFSASGVAKAYWPLVTIASFFATYESFRCDYKYKKLLAMVMVFAAINMGFGILPNLFMGPGLFASSDSLSSIAISTMERLNRHTAPLLTAITLFYLYTIVTMFLKRKGTMS